MRDEANIVELYAGADVSGRIDILIRFYPNFMRLVKLKNLPKISAK